MFEKVLLIDDDEVTLILCEFIMDRYDFAREVIKLKNGQEGIDFCADYVENKKQGLFDVAPSLIFLDLNMPAMDGWEFLDDFCAKFPDLISETKVVVLSSTIHADDFSRCAKYDMVVDFINKPLNDAAISSLLKNPKLQHLILQEAAPDYLV